MDVLREKPAILLSQVEMSFQRPLFTTNKLAK